MTHHHQSALHVSGRLEVFHDQVCGCEVGHCFRRQLAWFTPCEKHVGELPRIRLPLGGPLRGVAATSMLPCGCKLRHRGALNPFTHWTPCARHREVFLRGRGEVVADRSRSRIDEGRKTLDEVLDERLERESWMT